MSEGQLSGSVLIRFPTQAGNIALIIANWTSVESILFRWLAYLLKTDENRALMIWNEVAATNQKIKLLKFLVEKYIADSPDRKTLLSILSDAQNRSNRRHWYAHAVYSSDAYGRALYVTPGIGASNYQQTDYKTVQLTDDMLRTDLESLVSLANRAHLFDLRKVPLTG
jgi:hypothetical protein